MTRPLVTVVMNCFNGEAFLRHAIDSVVAQTWMHWEIVFWDNQSTDDSAAIVKSYDDPRIHYFYAPSHTPLYEARNCAIEKASGELLAFLDVDDWWLPEKLERQVTLFSDPEVSVVYGNYWVINERKGRKWVAHKKNLPNGHILDPLLENYRVGLLTLTVRQAHLPLCKPPFDPRFHIIGDFDLVIRLASKGKVACVQEPVAVYRIHGANETALRRCRHLEELACWFDEMSHDSTVVKSKKFGQVHLYAEYVKAIGMLLDGKRMQAARIFYSMRWSKFKIRIFVALLLPRMLIAHIKN